MVRGKRTNATGPVLTSITGGAPQSEEKKAGSIMSVTRPEWDEFWSRIWSAVWNAIGLATVVIAFIGISGWIAYAVYDSLHAPNRQKPSLTSPAHDKLTQLSYSEKRSLQSAFNVLLANDKGPCAVKGKGDEFSNVKGCSLFRITLGSFDTLVAAELDKSGYFPSKSIIYDNCKNEKEDCIHGRWISNTREGFSIRVQLNHTTDTGIPSATEIALSFNAGAHPYFDPQAIRSAFVKLIGPPDYSGTDADSWGRFGGPYVWASITKDKEYSVTLQDRSMIKVKKEGNQTKKEGDKK